MITGCVNSIEVQGLICTGDVTGDVLVKEFDIHYQIDSIGSNSEYIK